MPLLTTIIIATAIQAQAINLEFRRFTPSDGFPMVAISSLAQDGDGNIWISNNEGGAVYKFDGFNVQRIPAVNAGRIFISSRNDIYYPEAGQFIRLSGNNKTILPLRLTSQQWKYRIVELPDGNLFITTPESNYRYNPENNELSVADDIKISQYISATAVSEGILYLATENGEVYRKGEGDPLLLYKMAGKITNLLPAKDGRLFVGTPSHGLWLIGTNPGDEATLVLEENCTWICQGNGNDLWIGSNTGLFIYNTESNEVRKVRRSNFDPFSLPHYSVRHIMRDNQGGMWIGTQYGGVCYWNPHRSHVIRLLDGTDQYHLCNSVASHIIENEDGRILIGTNGGLNIYDPSTGMISHHLLSNEDGYDDVKAIAPIGSGCFLIGYYKSGLQLFNIKDGTFRQLNSPRSVYRILPDGNDSFLLGTEERLQLYNLSSNRYKVRNKLPAMTLFKDSKGRLWQGGNNTIVLSDSLQFEIPAIRCMLETRSGHFLVGTDNGLFRFEDGKTSFFRQSVKGLPDEASINGMEQDLRGKIWIGTTNGLYMIDEDYGKCLRFSAADGLATDYLYNYSHCRLSSGNLCFGGIGGVSIFDPEKMEEARSGCPAPVISSIKVHGEEYIPSENAGVITFKHSENNLRFTFSTPDYLSQGNNLFRYRLEGFDSKWYNCGNDRTASYSNLPKGRYRLMVECSRNGEFWTAIKEPLAFRVRPVWFLSTVAIIMEIILLMASVIAAFLFINRRRELENALEMKALEERHAKELSRLKALKFINASPRGVAGTGRVVTKISETDERFLTRAISIVENSISDEKFNIETLASRMGVSRMKLYTEMKRITGGSAIDLIHKIRFTEACRLLEQTDKTASEIAYETGFSSPVYFSESFRKTFGCTPKDYAKKHKH